MKCKKCGTEFNEGIFCPECGTKYEPDENRSGSVVQGFEKDSLDPQTSRGSYGQYDVVNIQKEENKKKASLLSIWAAVLAVLSCTALIAVVLAVIDISRDKKDEYKHGASIFALVWSGIIIGLTVLMIWMG